eukprot:8066438-Alexandrium_andersonii.AAC.1
MPASVDGRGSACSLARRCSCESMQGSSLTPHCPMLSCIAVDGMQRHVPAKQECTFQFDVE